MAVLGLNSKDRKSTGDNANICNPKVNGGCPPLTANRTSADCVQISLGPSIPYIPLGVYNTGERYDLTRPLSQYISHLSVHLFLSIYISFSSRSLLMSLVLSLFSAFSLCLSILSISLIPLPLTDSFMLSSSFYALHPLSIWFKCILFIFQQIRAWINSPHGLPLIPMAAKNYSVVRTILQVGGVLFIAQLLFLILAWRGKNPLKYTPAASLAGRQCHGGTNEREQKIEVSHDDVIKWKYFPRYWPFVRWIHRWPVDSPH